MPALEGDVDDVELWQGSRQETHAASDRQGTMELVGSRTVNQEDKEGMSDWKKSEKMPGLEQNEADGRYRLRVQTTNGAQSLVLNKLYSINELETIRELMRTSLTESGRRLDRSEVPVPAATEDQTKPEDDEEDLLDELAAAEARIEELEEALAKVGGDSDAPSDGEDWRQRALDAEEKVAELECARDKQNETIDGLTLRLDERADDLRNIEARLIEACEEWGIEVLDGLSTEALTQKVCVEYTNLYNEQTIALREAEEDARTNHALSADTDACDANIKKHQVVVRRLVEVRDRREQEAKEAREANDELAVELRNVRA